MRICKFIFGTFGSIRSDEFIKNNKVEDIIGKC